MVGFFYYDKSFKSFYCSSTSRGSTDKNCRQKASKTGDIHLIGFSLGSHVMGRTGRAMKDAKKEVGRITGKTIKKYHFWHNI